MWDSAAEGIRIVPAISDAKTKRIDQLQALQEMWTFTPAQRITVDQMDIFQEFITNGAHGIRKLGKWLDILYHPDTDDVPDHVLNRLLNTLARQGEEAYMLAREANKKRTQRKAVLVAALAARGLEFRDDSKLCEMYVNGWSDMPLDEIVATMDKMHFFHTYTQYSMFLKGVRKSQDEYLQIYP